MIRAALGSASVAACLAMLVAAGSAGAQVTGSVGPCLQLEASATFRVMNERERARQHDEASCIREGLAGMDELCRGGCDDGLRQSLRQTAIHDCERLWGWSCAMAPSHPLPAPAVIMAPPAPAAPPTPAPGLPQRFTIDGPGKHFTDCQRGVVVPAYDCKQY